MPNGRAAFASRMPFLDHSPNTPSRLTFPLLTIIRERKKFGFFQPEEPYFSDIANSLGLIEREETAPYWCRHPLAFLVEAADDICYAIIDIEDGFELRYLNFEEAKEVLSSMASQVQLTSGMADSDKIGKLRAVAIGNLIHECVNMFIDHEQDLLNGSFGCSLIDLTKFKNAVDNAKHCGRRESL